MEVSVNCLVVVSLLFWGAWGIFDKKALEFTSPAGQLIAIYAFSPLVAVVTMILMSVFMPGWRLSEHTIFYNACGSLVYFMATAFYLKVMNQGEASFILGATASYPVAAQVLAYLFLGEQLVLARMVGCLVVVAGIVLIGSSAHGMKAGPFNLSIGRRNLVPRHSEREAPSALPGATAAKEDFVPDYSLTAGDTLRSEVRVATIEKPQPPEVRRATPINGKSAFIAAVAIALAVMGWAARGIFDKIAVNAAHPFEVYLGKCVCDTAIGAAALIWFLRSRKQMSLSRPQLWPMAAGSALCLAGGSAAYFVALSMASASYVLAITGCYPLLMYILAIVILKERFNSTRAVGIALITLGGILTQTTQSS